MLVLIVEEEEEVEAEVEVEVEDAMAKGGKEKEKEKEKDGKVIEGEMKGMDRMILVRIPPPPPVFLLGWVEKGHHLPAWDRPLPCIGVCPSLVRG